MAYVQDWMRPEGTKVVHRIEILVGRMLNCSESLASCSK